MIKETCYTAAAICSTCGKSLKSDIGHTGKITGHDVQDWAHNHAETCGSPVHMTIEYTVIFKQEDKRLPAFQ